jgi:4-aminobutyrate aminotransferase-like enzyme/Ser/Thr protein kinase RdoA (MazF antagonist)
VSVEPLLALRGQPPDVDARLAEATARDIYGVTARATPLAGERDRNFRLDATDGQCLILKFIDHEVDDVVVAGQSAALVHIAEQDGELPVPRVIRTRSGDDLGHVGIAGQQASAPGAGARDPALRLLGGQATCRVRLITYLPGRLIQDLRPSPASGALLRSVGNQVAHLDRALAGFFHPALGQPIVWDIRRAPALLSVLPQVRSPTARRLVGDALEPIHRLLPQLRGLRSQAIHGDCHGRNLIANDNGPACVGIIDLGDMIHAPLALEVGVTMAEFLVDGLSSLDGLCQLVAGYTGVQTLQRADIDVLYDAIAARIAIGVLIQAWRDHNNTGVVTRDGGGPHASALEEMSAKALDELASRGKEGLTRVWLEAAGVAAAGLAAAEMPAVEVRAARVSTAQGGSGRAGPGPDGAGPGHLLRRRHAALGVNAELSYDRPLHLVRGEGVWVYTADGERLLDVYNNVPHVGHAHPVVVAAIAEQARRIASNTRYLDERIVEYVERLTATLPPDLDACLFVNSGSEANDIAWRIAKSHTGHEGALVMTHSYHGITDAVAALSTAISATIAPHIEQLAAPLAHAPPSVSANAADRAIAAAAEADVSGALSRLAARGFRLAALMIDSALTSTGIYDPPPSWVEPIAAAVQRAGGLIIGDEVQFGLGRSGSDFWGFARRGYHPDIVTLGKPVGNGYPLGVVITRRAILEKFQRDTGFFSTFGGNPVAGAAGLAVLDVLEQEQLVDNARVTGGYFISRLRELAPKYDCIKDVRGQGLLIGVEVSDRTLTKQLVNNLRDRGVLIGSEGPKGNVLKLRPPMPFRSEHVDLVIDALTTALSAAHP